MHVHEVVIVPWGGHGGGYYDPGYATNRLCEIDVVDGYVRAIADELDDCAVRHRVLPTRTAPGLSDRERIEAIFPNSLVLSCRVGWFRSEASRMPKVNVSKLFYGAKEALSLSKKVGEALEHWGQIYIEHGHRIAGVIHENEDRLINVEGTWGMRLEPFALNGPNAQEYCSRLEQLGRDVGRVLTNYLIAKDQGRSKPSTLMTMRPRGTF